MAKYIVKDHMGREIGTAEKQTDFGDEVAGGIGLGLALLFMPLFPSLSMPASPSPSPFFMSAI